MTVEQTIENLYSDIAEIKEFICKSEDIFTYDFVSSANVTTASTVTVPVDCEFCSIVSTGAVNLSRNVDRLSNAFDEFTFSGFGTVSQGRIDRNNQSSIISFEKIDAINKLIIINKFSTFIHLNLDVRVTSRIDFYKKILVII